MNIDVESLQPRQFKRFKRKWKSLPRFLKLYLSITLLIVIFLIVYILLPKTNESLVKRHKTGENNKNIKNENDDLPQNFQDNNINNDVIDSNSNDKQVNEILNEKHQDFNSRNSFQKEKEKENELINLNHLTDDSLSAELFAESSLKYQNKEQEAIRNAAKHSWNAYKTYAWGADHLKPITKSKHNWFGVGLTILDSIDTLIIMGLKKEYEDALDWVKNSLRFDIYKDVNCFEMTIRSLGGLLSAYHLTKEATFLIKASDLGERLIHCFDPQSKSIPLSDVNLRTKIPKTPNWSPDSSLSEATTVQVEFRDLTYLTGVKKYEKISFKTSEYIHNHTIKTGQVLLPMFINPFSGQFSRGTITLGARGDSYYEYLLKQYVQTGIKWLKDDYVKAMDEVNKRLVTTTKGSLKLTFIGEITRSSNEIYPKMDHLVCFLSGTLALGYYHEILKLPKIRGHMLSEEELKFNDHMTLAEKLARTCNFMYNLTGTGLSPEIAYFSSSRGEDELQIRPADAHNLLRPEFVESLFYLYHITGNQIYRDWAWNIFQAFEKYTKVSSGGYTSINDVRFSEKSKVRPKDMQESFWLSETLKYLYLIFCDDKEIINRILDNYVINTEGHLFPRRLGAIYSKHESL